MTPLRPDADHAEAVLDFWFGQSKPGQWYQRDAAFDREIKRRFSDLHKAAKDGALDVWRAAPRHALARIIILDQFSRNLYRDDPRAFTQDDMALMAARDALARRFDLLFAPDAQAFFLMPFMHSEDIDVQEMCVRLFKTRQPGAGNLPYALEHRDIIARFGRFPHRNGVLGRQSTPAEKQFLARGGFNP